MKSGQNSNPPASLTLDRVIRTWWPLGASWLLMSVELPAVSAIIARLQDPEVHLAAYGGVVFPLALLIESPVIMLLAASTALTKDWSTYVKLRRFMMAGGAVLTVLHILLAFTPVYTLVVEGIMGVPAPVVNPARLGLIIMIPWTWSIAYRRFNQGVLIRFGHSRAVSVGTLIRLLVDAVILMAAFWSQTLSGTAVATLAVTGGVVSEAIYVGWRVRPVLKQQVQPAPLAANSLTLSAFLRFYIPLALTSFLGLFIQPIGSAAISRMSRPLESLAVWPVVFGLIFMLRSLGLAYQEVVVALLDEPGSARLLRRFTFALTTLTTFLLLVLALTPLAAFWFETVSGLSRPLSALAETALWFGLLLPGLSVLRNWLQGILVHVRRTRCITESVLVFLISCGGLLWAGTQWATIPGVHIGLLAFTLGAIAQVVWMWWRSMGEPVLGGETGNDIQKSKKQKIEGGRVSAPQFDPGPLKNKE